MLTNTVSDLPPFLAAQKINAVDCLTDGEGFKAISLFFPSFVQRSIYFLTDQGQSPRTSGGWLPPLAQEPKGSQHVLYSYNKGVFDMINLTYLRERFSIP
jgi:hypothetical protein